MSATYRDEDAWTAALAARLSRRSDMVTGIGDDAAVVRCGDRDVVYTSDAVVEGVHFVPGTEPVRIGHKLVGRLLSDIAAMGATPAHVLINLVVPASYPARDMDAMYAGAEKLAAEFGASIVGGDTMVAAPLALHGFAAGYVPLGGAVLRSGARAGDLMYVTGTLGGSMAGKHLDFTPRVREGVWLREGGWATSMMDLSDGLARDLPRLCERSGAGAVVQGAAVPRQTDLDHALHDGEDYELLFTVNAHKREAFERAWSEFSVCPCTCIGRMEGSPADLFIEDVEGRRAPMIRSGFDHLSRETLDRSRST